LVIATALILTMAASPVKASGANYIMIGPAMAQIFDGDNVLYNVAEFRHYFKNNVGGALTSLEIAGGTYYIALGVFRERRLFAKLYVSISLSPGLLSGNGKKKMGCVVEFRSSFEISYRVANDYRLGLSINHYSNSGLGDINPGTESLRLMLSVPIS
jgi:hypothetical protein